MDNENNPNENNPNTITFADAPVEFDVPTPPEGDSGINSGFDNTVDVDHTDVVSVYPNTDSTVVFSDSSADTGNSDSRQSADFFNPDIHATDDSGNPIRNKSGSYRKKRGRKKGLDSADIAGQQVGVMMAGIFFGVAQQIGGDEWQPTPIERENIGVAAGVYANSKGIEDLPPGIALAIVVIAYAAPRFTKPQTRQKMSRARKNWRIFKWFNRKKETPPKVIEKETDPMADAGYSIDA